MIVVEGPDGAGKSTLVRKLMTEFNLPMHERASEGVAGPVSDLFGWAHRDVVSMADQEISVYDRHPLISEYVYGPICRSTLPPGFTTSTAHALVRMMAMHALVVLCRPPSERLKASVAPERDMPGVTEHIERIASAYDALRIFWPGQILSYDYTFPEQLGPVMATCRIHVAAQRQRRLDSAGRH